MRKDLVSEMERLTEEALAEIPMKRRLFVRKLPGFLKFILVPILFPGTMLKITKGILGVGLREAKRGIVR